MENENNIVKKATVVIALDEPDTLRDRLGCSEWASTESLKVMMTLGLRDISLIRGLSHGILKRVDLEDATINNMPEKAFEGCDSLECIHLPNCNSIPANVFSNCSALREIKISKQVTTIGEYAFTNCKSLSEITIPHNVSYIGEKAFFKCDNLQKINCQPVFPPICNIDTFQDIHPQCTFIIPRNSLEAYSSDSLWGKFKLIVAEE